MAARRLLRQRRNMLARQRIFSDRTNPLEFSDDHLIQAYQFLGVSIIKLMERIADKLNQQKSNCALLPVILLSAAERRGTPVLLSASVSDNFGNSPQMAAPRRSREIDQSMQRFHVGWFHVGFMFLLTYASSCTGGA